MKLTAEKIQENYNTFFKRIDQIFDEDRATKLKRMYNDLGEERLMFAPASSINYFHNAIPGGYVDHVLRVMNFSASVYKAWQQMGLETSNFSLEELMFAALNHDLGKLGYPGDNKEGYVVNHSDWHVKNQGKMYNKNEHIPFSTVPVRSLFLLQMYGVSCSWNEYLGIYLHDGMYDESTKPFYVNYVLEGRLRSNLPKILHQADLMASQFEFEVWNKETKSLNIEPIETVVVETPKKEIKPTRQTTTVQNKKELVDSFKTVFEDK